MAQQTRGAKKSATKVVWNFPLERTNWMILGGGVGTIILGYLIMHFAGQAQWDSPLAITLAPIMLVIGFIVLIPYGIMWRPKNSGTPTDGGAQ